MFFMLFFERELRRGGSCRVARGLNAQVGRPLVRQGVRGGVRPVTAWSFEKPPRRPTSPRNPPNRARIAQLLQQPAMMRGEVVVLCVLTRGFVHGFALQACPLIERALPPVGRFRLERVVDRLSGLAMRAKRIVLHAHRLPALFITGRDLDTASA